MNKEYHRRQLFTPFKIRAGETFSLSVGDAKLFSFQHENELLITLMDLRGVEFLPDSEHVTRFEFNEISDALYSGAPIRRDSWPEGMIIIYYAATDTIKKWRVVERTGALVLAPISGDYSLNVRDLRGDDWLIYRGFVPHHSGWSDKR